MATITPQNVLFTNCNFNFNFYDKLYFKLEILGKVKTFFILLADKRAGNLLRIYHNVHVAIRLKRCGLSQNLNYTVDCKPIRAHINRKSS